MPPLLKAYMRLGAKICGEPCWDEDFQVADVFILLKRDELCPHLQPHQLLVSIAAGITCASLLNWLGRQPLVRCMPNTPALLGKGVSGLFATADVTAEQRQQAEQLLSAVGIVVWVDSEAQIDAVTAGVIRD